MKYIAVVLASLALGIVIFGRQSPVNYGSVASAEAVDMQKLATLEQLQQMQEMAASLHDAIDELVAAQAMDAIEHQQHVESLEEKIRSQEQKFVSLVHAEPEPSTQVCECECDCEDLRQRVEKLEQQIQEKAVQVSATPSVSSVSYGSTGTSYGSTGTSYGSTGTSYGATGSLATSGYTPRWTNYDGLTKSQHAEVYHGIDTSGMSATQIAMALDADHDRYGGGHSQIKRTRSVSTTYCPGGYCPTGPAATWQRSVSVSKPGLLGRVFGRR